MIYMFYLTIRPVAIAGYGSIAHEAKLNGLLTRGPGGWTEKAIIKLANAS